MTQFSITEVLNQRFKRIEYMVVDETGKDVSGCNMKYSKIESAQKALEKYQANGATRRAYEPATPEEIRAQQIATAERRSAPMKPLNRRPIHLQDEE